MRVKKGIGWISGRVGMEEVRNGRGIDIEGGLD